MGELAEVISAEVRKEIGAPPLHTVIFPRVCSALVSESVLVETWARGVTVASLFPQLDTRDADELHRALAAPVAATVAATSESTASTAPTPAAAATAPTPTPTFPAATASAADGSSKISTSQWVRRGDATNDPRVLEQRRLASKILDMSFKMFLRDNYVHGDLHAGNLVQTKKTKDSFFFTICSALFFLFDCGHFYVPVYFACVGRSPCTSCTTARRTL